MPRKRSKSPKHRTRSKSPKHRTRSKSKTRSKLRNKSRSINIKRGGVEKEENINIDNNGKITKIISNYNMENNDKIYTNGDNGEPAITTLNKYGNIFLPIVEEYLKNGKYEDDHPSFIITEYSYDGKNIVKTTKEWYIGYKSSFNKRKFNGELNDITLTKSGKLRRSGEESIYKMIYPSNYYKIEYSTLNGRNHNKIYYCTTNDQEKTLEFYE
jgi:hypothetical protein